MDILFYNDSKIETSLEYIEAFVDHWGWFIVGDLKNSGQAADEHVGKLFKVILKSWLLKGSKKIKYYDLYKK